MSTKKKEPFKYDYSEEKPTFVEEPLIKYPALNLDLSKRYTYADYLTWLDDKLRELIDGIVHFFASPVRIHQEVSHKLNYLFSEFIYKRRGKCQIYYAPFAVRLPVDNSTDDNKIYNVVLPDICVVCDPSKLDDKGCIGAPDLIVEILSPSTAKTDWTKKFNLYQASGVREYWIADPKEKVINVFLLKPDGKFDDGTVYFCHEKVPVYIFDGLEIDLKEVFEE